MRESRDSSIAPKIYGRSLIAIFAALALSVVVILLISDTPLTAITLLLTGAVRSELAFGNMLASAARLTIAGIAATIVFRAGLFNLGGEGQALVGGLSAAMMAMAFPNLPSLLALGLSIMIGIIAGGLMGAISGMLKTWLKVDELISSFLLSSAMLPVGAMLLGGHLKDPESYLIAAPPLPTAYRLALWMPPSRLGPMLVIAILLSLAAVLFLFYTRWGYEWRLFGMNPAFAAYGGIRVGRITVLAMALSGGLFGLAGTAALLDGGQAVQGFTSGLGWNGLAVALIARIHPGYVPLAVLAYSWLEAGTQSAIINTGFPYTLVGLVQGAVFLLVTVGTKFRGSASA